MALTASLIYRLVRFVGDKELGTAAAGVGESERVVDPAYAPDHTVAFADGYPFLFATEVLSKRPRNFPLH